MAEPIETRREWLRRREAILHMIKTAPQSQHEQALRMISEEDRAHGV